MKTGHRIAIAFSGLGLLAGAIGCDPAYDRPPAKTVTTTSAVTTASAVKPSAPPALDGCSAISPIKRRETAVLMDAAARMERAGRSIPGIVGAIREMNDTFRTSSAELAALHFSSSDNATDAAAAVAETDLAAVEFDKLLAATEGGVRSIAKPIDDARDRARELRARCDGKRGLSRACQGIKKTFADAELARWTTRDEVDRSIAKIAQTPVKDPAMAHDLDVVRAALVAATSAMTDLDAANERAPKTSNHVDLALNKMMAIEKRCGESTALAPADWISSSGTTDPRKLTVLVLGILPEPMRKVFDGAGGMSKGDLSSGTTGSGVVVVRQIAGKQRVFVVTNRHVVEYAASTKIRIDGVEQPSDAKIVYVDPYNDLAVLEMVPDASGTLPFTSGVALETNAPTDQQSVIAAGYPGMGSRPSYQVTRGYISNHHVAIAGEPSAYIQHTAPIDPGSSGGPLLSESGRLLGVNTLKLRDRENVALTIPADVVVDALRAAEKSSIVGTPQSGRDACLDTLAELSASVVADSAGRRLSPSFVATVGPVAVSQGMQSAPPELRVSLETTYHASPLPMLHGWTLRRIQEAIAASGGMSTLEMCDHGSGDGRNMTFSVQTIRGAHDLKLGRERGAWTVTNFDLPDLLTAPSPSAKAKRPAKKPKT